MNTMQRICGVAMIALGAITQDVDLLIFGLLLGVDVSIREIRDAVRGAK